MRKGLPLIDNVGPVVFDLVRENDELTIRGRTVYRDSVPLVRGERLAGAVLQERLTRANRPALVAVDGAADLLLESVSDRTSSAATCTASATLLAGCPLLVHAYPDGRAPGKDRLKRMGLATPVFACPGASEDAALLLLNAAGANPVVLVGSHATPLDCLEKGRAGMASTLLVCLKQGNSLIDA